MLLLFRPNTNNRALICSVQIEVCVVKYAVLSVQFSVDSLQPYAYAILAYWGMSQYNVTAEPPDIETNQ